MHASFRAEGEDQREVVVSHETRDQEGCDWGQGRGVPVRRAFPSSRTGSVSLQEKPKTPTSAGGRHRLYPRPSDRDGSRPWAPAPFSQDGKICPQW